MTEATPALEFEEVSKTFGNVVALEGVSFTVPAGTVVGFIGRNGAGKSTAIRCLVGLQRPTTGHVKLLGAVPWDLDTRLKQQLGYLSETGVPFPWASAQDLIEFCAPLYPTWDRELERGVLSRFGIDPKRKLKTLSLGQQRAVGLLLAICHRPRVLVLDEPAANLDAVLRREFLEQVLELVADQGRTVFFSSHLLTDVERVANRLAILHAGELLLYQELDELKENVKRLRLIFPERAPDQVAIPRALRIRRAGREILATVVGYSADTVHRLSEETGATVEVQTLGLEELFIDLVGDDSPVLAA